AVGSNLGPGAQNNTGSTSLQLIVDSFSVKPEGQLEINDCYTVSATIRNPNKDGTITRDIYFDETPTYFKSDGSPARDTPDGDTRFTCKDGRPQGGVLSSPILGRNAANPR